MRYGFFIHITFLVFIVFLKSFSQDYEYEIRQLTNSKGLSNSSINAIFQDSENLLWIGTWDGLNRYDGHDFTIFYPELNNPNSLSNQVVLNIIEDKDGYIWIVTMHGINRYNKRTNNFKSFFFTGKDKPPITETEFHIALNKDKTVFCAAKEWGIGYYKNDTILSLNAINLFSSALKKMEFSSAGNLLLLYETGSLSEVALNYHHEKSVSIKSVKTLMGNVSDFINISGQEMLVLQNNGQLSKYSFLDQDKYATGISGIQRFIGETKDGYVFEGNSGLILLNQQMKIVTNSWFEKISDQNISTVFEGNENILWIGTDGNGLFKLYPRQKLFQLFSDKEISALAGANVRAFCEIPGNSFWVGTKGNGLFSFQPDLYPETIEKVSFQNYNATNSILNNSIYFLFYGQDSLLYIGSDGTGLYVFDLKYSKIISWNSIQRHEECTDFRSVYSIFQDQDGILWIGTNGYGMIRCKIERYRNQLKIIDFKQYLADDTKAGSLSSNIIFSIIPESKDKLWIGTRLGGLNLFNTKSGYFKVFRKNENSSLCLSNDDILCLNKDNTNQLWIGTSLGLNRLIRYNTAEQPVFKSYTTKDGLPNNTIHGIVCDSNGNLWISTNFGLSQFIIKENRFRNFTYNDGLQNNEFSDGAFFITKNTGIVFMGGINGFNCFNPSDIGEYTYIPNISISEIKGQNFDVPFHHSFVVTPGFKTPPFVVLKYNQNFFDIKLAVLSYINSEKCQYAYQLVNFDQTWNSIQFRRNISFTNVPPGKYSLWLKWSNCDGIWSHPVHAIDFQIKPIFWRSTYAIIIYLLLIFLFLLFILNYNKKRQLLRQNIMLRQREEDIHQNRLTFFTNIAHEIQTPLTLIIGPAQKLAESAEITQAKQKFVRMIQRNAYRLSFLIQQLLDFRKAESGHLETNFIQFNLVHLLEQIAELFDELALQKTIDYRVDNPLELFGWFDQDKIEKILFNLLSNAFKYTPVNGTIRLKLSCTHDDTIEIVVSNTGKGISEEKIKYLFERFFVSDETGKADPDKLRTGIGLAYTKSLVTALNGRIELKSTVNEITTFTITLPYSKYTVEKEGNDFKIDKVILSRQLQNISLANIDEQQEIPEKITSIEALENQFKTILIVEDENDVHELLSDLLKDKYRIIKANNGIEALQIIEKGNPDIIISDIMMPEMDGIELCKNIKNNLKTCHIPVILLTAKNSVIHRIEGIESGANSYISKPFHPKHLEVSIKKLLEERERITKHFMEDDNGENISKLPIQNSDKEFINKVIHLIKQHINNDNLQATFLEKELGMSSSQFYRKLKQVSGLTPSDIIRTIRLKHSAKLLRTTSLTVTEVFYQSGFNNRSYFYREFQKMYKVSPKKYQLNY